MAWFIAAAMILFFFAEERAWRIAAGIAAGAFFAYMILRVVTGDAPPMSLVFPGIMVAFGLFLSEVKRLTGKM
jgi:hypothetical protein